MPHDLTTALRLLRTIDLSLPARELESAIFDWVSKLGQGPVASEEELSDLRSRLLVSGPAGEQLAMDVHLALGALSARRKELKGGWKAYVDAWRERIEAVGVDGSTELDAMRDLHDRLGGLLLNGRAAPFLLILPLSDGTWIKLGWDTARHYEQSPLQEGVRAPVLAIAYR